MLGVVEHITSKDRRSQPGVDPQLARLQELFLGIMGDIQVYLVRQPQDLSFLRNRVDMDKGQVDIGCPA